MGAAPGWWASWCAELVHASRSRPRGGALQPSPTVEASQRHARRIAGAHVADVEDACISILPYLRGACALGPVFPAAGRRSAPVGAMNDLLSGDCTSLAKNYPWLASMAEGLCCAPRSKTPLGGTLTSNTDLQDAVMEKRRVLEDVEEQPELKSEPEDIGVDPPSGLVAELRCLPDLLDSKECSSADWQTLLAFAARPEGPREIIPVLHALVAKQPRSLMPDEFSMVQELLGQLMLDAMQREDSDALRTLVTVSHAVTLVCCEECEECEE